MKRFLVKFWMAKFFGKRLGYTDEKLQIFMYHWIYDSYSNQSEFRRVDSF